MMGCPAHLDPDYEWKFKGGDLVVHVTNGSSVMVVSERSNSYEGVYYCTWVDSTGVKHSEKFLGTELKISNPNELQ